MPVFSVQAAYRYLDPHCLSVGTSEVALPAPSSLNIGRPEKIFIQALFTNTSNIVVSLTGVAADGSAGGFILPPGSNILLSCANENVLRAIAGGASQQLSVVYLAGAI